MGVWLKWQGTYLEFNRQHRKKRRRRRRRRRKVLSRKYASLWVITMEKTFIAEVASE
jgi:hypothetical protein